MSRYIIFQANSDSKEILDWKLEHTKAGTWILAEYWDSEENPIPEPGYRPNQHLSIATDINPNPLGSITHSRKGDWEVERVDEYLPDLPTGTEFTSVVICFCKYVPIDAPLKIMSDRIVSPDSFGGDMVKYDAYIESGGDVEKYNTILEKEKATV